MKQKILLFTFFLFSQFTIWAQKSAISFIPVSKDTTFLVDLVSSFQPQVISGKIKNNTNQKITVRWERNSIDIPQKWTTQIHDKNAYYPEFVSSNISSEFYLNEPIVLAPKESARLDISFIPNGKYGKATLGLDFSLADSPEVLIESEVIEVEVKSRYKKEASRGSIFPNPSGNFLNVADKENVGRLVVYNMVGRAVKEFKVTQKDNYDISDLPNGIYLIGLFDKKGNIIKTVRFSKRHARP